MVSYLDFNVKIDDDGTLLPSGFRQIGEIFLKNVSPSTVAFKFGVRNPFSTRVAPPYGNLDPEQEEEVSVRYYPKDVNTRYVTDIEILVTSVDQKFYEEDDIPQLFKRAAASDVQKHRFSFSYHPEEDLDEEDHVKKGSESSRIGTGRRQPHRSNDRAGSADLQTIPKSLHNPESRPLPDFLYSRTPCEWLRTWSPESSGRRCKSQ